MTTKVPDIGFILDEKQRHDEMIWISDKFWMMNDNRQGGAGLFTGGLGGPRFGGAGQLSPYLNIDPSYLSNSQPEYLYDTETRRGNFEKSFTSIGSSVCLGSVSGGVYGVYAGNGGLQHYWRSEM